MKTVPATRAELFDSHCHFDFAAFDHQRAEIWARCHTSNMNELVIPGTEPSAWHRAQTLSETFSGIYFGCGIHPWFVDCIDLISALESAQKVLTHPNCIAIGECGLDGSINTPLTQQLPLFQAQLLLANQQQLPVIIHAHKAHNLVQQQLKQHLTHSKLQSKGVIHAFTGSTELAQQYIQLGFKLGIGGSITYPRANKTRKAAATLPLTSLLLETDAPDMPLHGHQGQANSPERLFDIAQCLHQLRQSAGKTETLDEIIQQTTDNSRRLFNL